MHNRRYTVFSRVCRLFDVDCCCYLFSEHGQVDIIISLCTTTRLVVACSKFSSKMLNWRNTMIRNRKKKLIKQMPQCHVNPWRQILKSNAEQWTHFSLQSTHICRDNRWAYMPFLKKFVRREIETACSRVLTRITDSISFHDNRYAKWSYIWKGNTEKHLLLKNILRILFEKENFG